MYNISAKLIRNERTIAEALQQIRIFDGSGQQPPTCLSDFQCEYTSRQKTAMKRGVFHEVGWSMTTNLVEPAPIVFFGGRDAVFSQIPLSFLLEPERTNKTSCDPPEMLGAEVTWRFKKSSFCSTNPMQAVPTVLEANKTTSCAMAVAYGVRHHLKLSLADWNSVQHARSGTSGCSSQETIPTAWTTQKAIPICIPTSALLAPTSFTPYLACRYSVIVRIKVTGNGKAHLRLEMPLQVAYEGPGSVHMPHTGVQMSGTCSDTEPSLIRDCSQSQLPVYCR